MNKILKEDNRLPDVWEMEVFFHKGISKKFNVVNQIFSKEFLQITTDKNRIHLFPHDSYCELAFDERYSIMLELKKEKEANANSKAA